MIHIDMIRQDTRHPDKRRRHPGRAWCEVAGRRFETQGPAPIYKLTTLLWLHGHGGTEFEVWDDVSPFGKDAPCETDFSSGEREMVAQAAGRVTETDSPRPENARTAATHPADGPEHPQGQDDASAGILGPQTPVAA